MNTTMQRSERGRFVAKLRPTSTSTSPPSAEAREKSATAKLDAFLTDRRNKVGADRRRHRKWIKSAKKLLERRKMWFPSQIDLEKVRVVLQVIGLGGRKFLRLVGTDRKSRLTDLQYSRIREFRKEVKELLRKLLIYLKILYLA